MKASIRNTLTLLLLTFTLAAAPAGAATLTWSATASGGWSDAANWTVTLVGSSAQTISGPGLIGRLKVAQQAGLLLLEPDELSLEWAR